MKWIKNNAAKLGLIIAFTIMTAYLLLGFYLFSKVCFHVWLYH